MYSENPFPLRDIYSVSRLNRDVRDLLEFSYTSIWIEGEISNFSRPSSGHWYFSLKDSNCQIRCAMFRNRNILIRQPLQNGLTILARATVSLYEGRGEYQLIIDYLETSGDGAIRLAFEALKAKLAAEGLFSPDTKKSLPYIPCCVGVISSTTGAAIKDILSILQRRFPALPVVIYPVMVQGKSAAKSIIAALRLANQRQDCDVLILARGGGSLEDLQAFNDESLAREIYSSNIPIVSGVGHEIDFTIADFVADQRAATPSAAAELVAPEIQQILQTLDHLLQTLTKVTQKHIHNATFKLHLLEHRLIDPQKSLISIAQQLDHLEIRLKQVMQTNLYNDYLRLSRISGKLHKTSATHLVQTQQIILANLNHRLRRSMLTLVQQWHETTRNLGHQLHTISPLNTLERGYALVTTTKNELVCRINQTRNGDKIFVHLSDGKILCTTEEQIPT